MTLSKKAAIKPPEKRKDGTHFFFDKLKFFEKFKWFESREGKLSM